MKNCFYKKSGGYQPHEGKLNPVPPNGGSNIGGYQTSKDSGNPPPVGAKSTATDNPTPKELYNSLRKEAFQEMEIFSMFGIDFEAREKVKTYISAASYLRKIADGEYKPVIHAHWRLINLTGINSDVPYVKYADVECTECRKIESSVFYNRKFCPNCGADMREKSESKHES